MCSMFIGSYESKNKDPKEAHKHTQRRLDDCITLEQMLDYEVLQKLTRFMSQVCHFMSSRTFIICTHWTRANQVCKCTIIFIKEHALQSCFYYASLQLGRQYPNCATARQATLITSPGSVPAPSKDVSVSAVIGTASFGLDSMWYSSGTDTSYEHVSDVSDVTDVTDTSDSDASDIDTDSHHDGALPETRAAATDVEDGMSLWSAVQRHPSLRADVDEAAFVTPRRKTRDNTVRLGQESQKEFESPPAQAQTVHKLGMKHEEDKHGLGKRGTSGSMEADTHTGNSNSSVYEWTFIIYE